MRLWLKGCNATFPVRLLMRTLRTNLLVQARWNHRLGSKTQETWLSQVARDYSLSSCHLSRSAMRRDWQPTWFHHHSQYQPQASASQLKWSRPLPVFRRKNPKLTLFNMVHNRLKLALCLRLIRRLYMIVKPSWTEVKLTMYNYPCTMRYTPIIR